MRLQDLLQRCQTRLQKAGVDQPLLDTRLLAAHALGCDRLALTMEADRLLSDQEQAAIEELITRREAREPVGRLLGLREFWGLTFSLNEATLEPRPDSETLIEVALKRFGQSPPARILDLGTGTGCLLLALLQEWPQATGLGIDCAPRAVAQARANAQANGLEDRAMFQLGHWLEGLEGNFDLIVSNPPYIPARDLASLQPEVRDYDPRLALDGGADGLDPYRAIIPGLRDVLRPGGHVVLEVGIDQAPDVAQRLDHAGLISISITKDLGGIDRIVAGQRPT